MKSSMCTLLLLKWLLFSHIDLVDATDSDVRQSNLRQRKTQEAIAVGVLDPIAKFDIVNAVTNQVVGQLSNGTVIDLKQYGLSKASEITIVATVQSSNIPTRNVTSVQFQLDNIQKFMIENASPFLLCGNDGLDFKPCPRLTLGSHTVIATPYSLPKATGVVGQPVSIQFTIVNEVIPTTIAPTKVPTNAPMLAPVVATLQPTIPEMELMDHLQVWMMDSASRIKDSDSESDDMKQFVAAASTLVEHLILSSKANNNA